MTTTMVMDNNSRTIQPSIQPKAQPKVLGNSTLDDLRAEIDTYYEEMVNFTKTGDVSSILMRVAAMSARASQIRTKLVRNETKFVQIFRTKEIDPFLSECKTQKDIWSRLITVKQLEWDISKGL